MRPVLRSVRPGHPRRRASGGVETGGRWWPARIPSITRTWQPGPRPAPRRWRSRRSAPSGGMDRAVRSWAGESAWWMKVFRRTYPGLLAYAHRRIGTEDAADAVAEVSERRGQLYHATMPVDGWLYGALRTVVREMHRTVCRGRRRESTGSPGPGWLTMAITLRSSGLPVRLSGWRWSGRSRSRRPGPPRQAGTGLHAVAVHVSQLVETRPGHAERHQKCRPTATRGPGGGGRQAWQRRRSAQNLPRG